MRPIVWFDKIGMQSIAEVGGKIASLGEMINHLSLSGIKVPSGFATTAQAYRDFIHQHDLNQTIRALLSQLDVNDVNSLRQCGQGIRQAIMRAKLLPELVDAVSKAYEILAKDNPQLRVAVRSSATAEDLPNASFAGQQETFLNVCGIDAVLIAIKKVFASLYNDRAIAYRLHHHFDSEEIAISAGIQQMVRSDLATSGVMFTLDTESGFEKVVLITAAYGLGEAIVQGEVNPDEYYVYKPNLEQGLNALLKRNKGRKDIKIIYNSDGHGTQKVAVDLFDQQRYCLSREETEQLAKMAVKIEAHYQKHMDIEWAKDGLTGELFILQARPETVKSREDHLTIERFQIQTKAKILTQGRSVGQKIGQGKARVILKLSDMAKLEDGDVLVTDMTDPDWEPIMKRASAIVTNRGGRTCHAAIIAREAGIPAVVGCQNATKNVSSGDEVTISCAEGETGYVYQGIIPFEIQKTRFDKLQTLPLKIMLNLGDPERAFDFQFLPNAGVGLARIEFIINNMIGVHPNALLQFDKLSTELQTQIKPFIHDYEHPADYYVDRLREGIATIAAAFHPKPVIVRFSDFKSNEYVNLVGGKLYEPLEDNPMLGYRGACRYVSPNFKEAFELEIKAIRKVREQMGFTNLWVMVPFVRTVKEAKEVIDLLVSYNLKRSADFKIMMMCEIPSNALLANQFLEYFDGFSIGSNDLTQLTLGVDRDSGLIAYLFDECDPAVLHLLEKAITACKQEGKYIGICGQGPSDNPEFARWLIDKGIESISLNPDTVINTWLYLSKQTRNTLNGKSITEPELNPI